VKVVDVELLEAIYLDFAVEIGQSVELLFLSSPVEAILPILGQALDVG